MSRGYYKTYGRKVSAPITQTSIQFGKLFCENSNRPSASKSAGTVGKWGITSFTSLRSTNFTLGRQDNNSYGRSHGDVKKEKFVAQPAAPVPPKPKKFFKSRNAEPEPLISTSAPEPVRKHNKARGGAAGGGVKKPYVSPPKEEEEEEEEDEEEVEEENMEEQTEAMNLSSSVPANNTTAAPAQPHNPPIVLRIFKGTSQLLTQEKIHHPKKESRRRSHSGSDNSDSVSPKRHKSKFKDIEALRKDLEGEDSGSQEGAAHQRRKSPRVEEADDKCLEMGNDLLASTYVDFNSKSAELLDIKPQAETEAKRKLLRVLEDDPRESAPSSDLAVETEYEIVPKQEVKQEPPDASRPDPPKPDETTSDSENSEMVTDKTNSLAVSSSSGVVVKTEPQVPKISIRPVKKGSIFKSRGASGEKRNAHYIHKWSDIKETEGGSSTTPPVLPPTMKVEGEFESETLTRVTTYPGTKTEMDDEMEPITSVTCSKKVKEFYTVVRNVRKTHQIQESGEFQEFNDDVEYILDALQDNNPISTRCLSAISLASKCMAPAFRMHVRAHGTVTKFFKALHDATKDQRLGMCTATVMFVLSQDRLNMDVDRDSLELMLNLLESDTSHNSALEDCGLSDAQLQKTKERVRSLCQEIQEQGHGKHLNLDNITVGHLAMETLLSLTSRRAGEWFKEELRDLGGLEHIIKTVVDTCQPIDSSLRQWTPQILDRLRKADRCLRVLENVTLHNEENSHYLLTYGEGTLVDTVVRVFSVCDQQLAFFPAQSNSDKNSTGAVIRECLMSILKVLINLTHDFNNKSFGSTLTGEREGVIQASLHILLETPDFVPEDQKFDLTVLSLILLINMVEHSEANRKLVIEAKAPPDPDSLFSDNSGSAVGALVALFLTQEELARTEEKKTDAILDGEKPAESQQQRSHEEFIEETVALLLQKAGRHMEHTLIGAYIAILLGYLTINNPNYEAFVRSHMPDKNYTMMLSVLQKFYNFMTLTAAAGSVSSRGIKSTEMLIKHLTETDKAINCPPS